MRSIVTIGNCLQVFFPNIAFFKSNAGTSPVVHLDENQPLFLIFKLHPTLGLASGCIVT